MHKNRLYYKLHITIQIIHIHSFGHISFNFHLLIEVLKFMTFKLVPEKSICVFAFIKLAVNINYWGFLSNIKERLQEVLKKRFLIKTSLNFHLLLLLYVHT